MLEMILVFLIVFSAIAMISGWRMMTFEDKDKLTKIERLYVEKVERTVEKEQRKRSIKRKYGFDDSYDKYIA